LVEGVELDLYIFLTCPFEVLGSFVLRAWSPRVLCGKLGVRLRIDDDFELVMR
jgi:hypothetical protein